MPFLYLFNLEPGMQQKLIKLQATYILGGLLVSPLLPLMYLQGKKILRYFAQNPVVPPTGNTSGSQGRGAQAINLLVLGESTVEGIGVKTFEHSLSVQLAEALVNQADLQVRWHAVGKSGITAADVLHKMLPVLEDLQQYDAVVLVLGANDSFGLTTPLKWHKQISAIAGHLRMANPNVFIYLASMPPVGSFPALPQPTRWVLGRCNKLLDKTSKLLAQHTPRFFYSKAQFGNRKDMLCPDGVHPSAEGYTLWAAAIAQELLPHLPKPTPLADAQLVRER